MKYKIWNKKDKIKGTDAEYVIKSHNIKESDEIFLVIDDCGIITEIQFVDIIKSNLQLNKDLTAEETAQAYIDYKKEEENNTIKEQISLEETSKKIEILQAENNRLKEVEKEQDKMIMDNLYKMTMIESSIGGM